MRARLLILILLMCPIVAQANPASLNAQTAIAFGIIAFWALVVESGIATLALVSTGVLVVPLLILLVATNIAVFIFAFFPLTGEVSLWILEPGIVVVDALVIMLLSSAPFLQSGSFGGVTWRRALVASFLGNASSFFVGVIGSGAPWLEKMAG